MLPLKRSPPRLTGFTLIEIAISIAVLSFVLSGWLALYRVQMVKENLSQTKSRMNDISIALAKYKEEHGYLPCPAPMKAPISDPNFGKEDIAPGQRCKSLPLASLNGTYRASNPNATPGNDTVRIGTVPVIDLGLSVNHVVDKWGRRYIYAVSESLAETPALYDETNNGAITLYGESGAVMGPTPHHTPFVLLSTGKSGNGGVTLAGSNFGVPCPTGVDEGENCQLGQGTADAMFRVSEHAEGESSPKYFDDIVLNHDLSDPVTICGNQGKIYGPTAPGADALGCASILGTMNCPAGQVLTGINAGAPVCTAVVVLTTTCPANQVVSGYQADGQPICVADSTAGKDYDCPVGQVLKGIVGNAVSCVTP